jgi:hypothetical protein
LPESHVPRFQERVGTKQLGYMIPVRLPWRRRARPSATLHEIQGLLRRANLQLNPTCDARMCQGGCSRGRPEDCPPLVTASGHGARKALGCRWRRSRPAMSRTGSLERAPVNPRDEREFLRSMLVGRLHRVRFIRRMLVGPRDAHRKLRSAPPVLLQERIDGLQQK